jgi:hypothetical protein
MDALLSTIIVAGIGLSIACLTAEYVSRRRRSVKSARNRLFQRELDVIDREKHVPLTALQNHQDFLSKESGNRTDSAATQMSI